ncbi:hypothetical protein HDU85_000693 [Gaertneriomyces sp. JEL0708]|nr:hypothetical protein HDU85_000693 [Gaertneriomyces sp. JEL0708]
MVNSPLPTDIQAECRKAAKIIDQFIKPETGKGPDSKIPPHIIANAKGIAVLTVLKAGFIFSGRAGSGLVIAKLDNGMWSAPSAIGTAGMGVGGQIGAELTDFVIILNTRDAVKAFSHGGNVTLGGNLSVAAGPIGRNAEAAGTVGNLAAIYSYSKTRGLFAGVSLEGSVIVERKDANATFYQKRVTAKELLSGSVPPPPAAEELYRALNRRSGGAGAYMDPATSVFQNPGNMPASYRPPAPADPYNAGGPAAWASAPTTYSAPSNLHSSSTGFLSNTSSKPTVSQPAFAPSVSSELPAYNAGYSAGAPNFGSLKKAAPPPPSSAGQARAVAMYDFAGERADDLMFKKGDIINITKKTASQNDWWQGKCNGREGSVSTR